MSTLFFLIFVSCMCKFFKPQYMPFVFIDLFETTMTYGVKPQSCNSTIGSRGSHPERCRGDLYGRPKSTQSNGFISANQDVSTTPNDYAQHDDVPVRFRMSAVCGHTALRNIRTLCVSTHKGR